MQVVVRPCKFGQVLIATSIGQLAAVELGDTVEKCYRNFINRWKNVMKPISDDAVAAVFIDKVMDAVDNNVVDPFIPIKLVGTYFQRSVWEELRKIPVGGTVSYHDLAKKINRPDSYRAVGTACGANPIAIFVPCHRAVKADGTSPGFRWGVTIKQELMDREK